jgi:FkbM family methyltransferase
MHAIRERARFWWRSLQYLASRYVRRQSFMLARADVHGMCFRFKVEDSVGRHIFKHGIYEAPSTRWLVENLVLEPGDLAIDIGANIGWYSILLQRQAKPGATVFAFEPDPLNFRLLSENLALNNAQQVEAIEKAVGETSGHMQLHLYDTKNLGRHSLLPINFGSSIDVQTISVDEFLKQRRLRSECVKFVKMDVEGYEIFVLKGMARLLEHSPMILAEYSPQTMRKSGLDPASVLDTFAKHGFAAHAIGSTGLELQALEGLAGSDTTLDLVWIKTPKTAPLAG